MSRTERVMQFFAHPGWMAAFWLWAYALFMLRGEYEAAFVAGIGCLWWAFLNDDVAKLRHDCAIALKGWGDTVYALMAKPAGYIVRLAKGDRVITLAVYALDEVGATQRALARYPTFRVEKVVPKDGEALYKIHDTAPAAPSTEHRLSKPEDEALRTSGRTTIVPATSGCLHEWKKSEPKPKKWVCACGTLVYRSYEDYAWD